MKIITISNNKFNCNKTCKRTMWSPSKLGNRLFRLDKNAFPKANMGRYSATRYHENVVKFDGNFLDEHEIAHYSVYDKETGELVAILTSSKNSSLKLDSEKMDGTFIFYKDTEWNPIPHPEKGGQFIRFYNTVRVVSKDLIKEYPPGSLYLEKHEEKITRFLETQNIASRPRQLRISQNEYDNIKKMEQNDAKNNTKNDE